MSRVGRMAGALLAETRGTYFLVGNTKMPCNWTAMGFEPPTEIDAKTNPVLALVATGPVELGTTCLSLDLEGEDLARRLADCFVIQRTGSVSERLWRLVTGAREEEDEPAAGTVDARWLGQMPIGIWRIVQDNVLRCV